MENNLKCPKCSSGNLSADKKGFSGKKAVLGAIATGGIGLLAGTIGSNKMMVTCLNCGITYKATDYVVEKNKYDKQKEFNKKLAKGEVSNLPLIFTTLILSIVGLIISIKLFSNDWNFFGTIFSIATLLLFALFVFTVVEESKKQKKLH